MAMSPWWMESLPQRTWAILCQCFCVVARAKSKGQTAGLLSTATKQDLVDAMLQEKANQWQPNPDAPVPISAG